MAPALRWLKAPALQWRKAPALRWDISRTRLEPCPTHSVAGYYCWLQRLHLLAALLQPLLQGGHIGVKDWRQVQRNQLRKDQSTNHYQAQGLASFTTGAVSDRDRHRA